MKFWQKDHPTINGSDQSKDVVIHHFLREEAGEKSRVHLRIDPDGHGTLIVNASRILHLNPSAAIMARVFLEQTPSAQAIQQIRKSFRVSSRQAGQDYQQLQDQLTELLRPDGACPVHEMEIESLAPFSSRPSAPYRMDLAITYRCNNDCTHCYNQEHPGNLSSPSTYEYSTTQWKQVLDRLWQLGIPHILFTGGEPTLRSDLPELIAYAESLGQITGLNTNGRRLSDPTYVDSLLQAGLDHVQVTLESNDQNVHDVMVHARGAWQQTIQGIRNALSTRLYVMTNTTMLRDNLATMPATLDLLAELKVPTIGLNALIHSGRGTNLSTGLPEQELQPLLELAARKTSQNNQRLIWYTPTQYCHFDPMQLNLGIKGCTAALYNMCIEPNGNILPCQSYYSPLGNILTDDWSSIWNHDLAIQLRERRNLPAACDGCGLLPDCGGGCPLQFDSSRVISSREISVIQ